VAEPLKLFFDRERVTMIGAALRAVEPSFAEAQFVAEASSGLADLELMGRGRHVMEAMQRALTQDPERALPQDPERALDVIVRSLGVPFAGEERGSMAPFVLLPHAMFVGTHGLLHHEASMRAIHAITQRFTGEWCIRPFLEREPERTFAVLTGWARDPSHHVRRLVSEGTRPRLPWAPRVRALVLDPTPGLALLDMLRDDDSEYVRRSVANHLNDVGRDHPERLVGLAGEWMREASTARAALVRHALRSLVKKGDAAALRVLGFGGSGGRALTATVAVTPRRPRIGDRIRIEAEVQNPGARRARAVVDFVIHFVKSRGETSPRVFKGREVDVAGGERVALGKTVTVADLSTRTHHPGDHQVDLVIDGAVRATARFDLRPS